MSKPSREAIEGLLSTRKEDTLLYVDLPGAWPVSLFALCTALLESMDRVERHEAALQWYAEQVAGCRKITSEGDTARKSLDRDGGERARKSIGGSNER